MRLLAKFEKRQAASLTSHLDLQRNMQRALRRTGLPIAYSKGFNPHAVLSFATALPLGYESVCEIMDIQLSGDADVENAINALNAALPTGLTALEARLVGDSFPTLTACCYAACYTIALSEEMGEESVAAFLASDEVLMDKKSKSGMRKVDIRPLVHEMRLDGQILHLKVTHTGDSALRPDLLLKALNYQGQARVLRTELLNAQGGDLFLLAP